MSDTTSPATDKWVTPEVSYVEPLRIFCAFCGRPIARRHWRAAPAGEELPFCDPSHAELYVTYWMPIHGRDDMQMGDDRGTNTVSDA